MVDPPMSLYHIFPIPPVHTISIIISSSKPDPTPPLIAYNHDYFPFEINTFNLGNFGFQSLLGISGTELTFSNT